MNNSLPANYDEKVSCLSGEEFFDFFSRMNAEPQWVNSAGKHSIQIIGRCHHGQNHSAVFDLETRKVTCFSECGCGMMLHTWVKRALDMDSPQEAKDFIEDWMDGQDIDFSSRDPTELDDNTINSSICQSKVKFVFVISRKTPLIHWSIFGPINQECS